MSGTSTQERLYLSQPSLSFAIHIKVRDLDHPFDSLGSNQYEFHFSDNYTKNQLLWLHFDQPYQEARDAGKTLAGLPMCIFERLHEIKIEQLQWIRCPSYSRNENALKGMSAEFLAKLGIDQEIQKD